MGIKKEKDKAWYGLFMSMSKDEFGRLLNVFSNVLIDRGYKTYTFGDNVAKKEVKIVISDRDKSYNEEG